MLLLAGACGGNPDAARCDGIEVRGGCWVATGGVSLSRERVDRLVGVAAALWEREVPALPGWRVELGPGWVVVDGERFGGYTWPAERTIAVAVGSPDCFERSAILHELGHAWGFGHDDPRMSSEWAWIREAMRSSQWPGCELGDDGEDDDGGDDDGEDGGSDARALVRTPR
ncbi:MAG TPA: hypothetical protein VFM53_03300 [Anaeromyxobacteraceae bacterium]|nr:hypothetical protein [Anaeromyxobacteraceae bacterium]